MNELKLKARNAWLAVLAMTAIAAILAFAAVMTVSAQSDDPDWKLAPTGLNVSAGDQAGELNITWDAHPQTTKTLSDYRVTWTPDGESFKTNDHTEWYAYPTTNQVSVTGLDAGDNLQGQGPGPVQRQQRSRAGVTSSPDRPASSTNTAPPPVNRP